MSPSQPTEALVEDVAAIHLAAIGAMRKARASALTHLKLPSDAGDGRVRDARSPQQ